MRRALFIAALMVPWGALPSRAAEVTLTPAAPAALYRPVGRSIDVVGLSPGMSPDAVKAVLGRRFADLRVQQGTLGIEDRGVMVATQSYVTQITAQNDTEQVMVWFGTPTTGNALVQATQQVTYFEAAKAPPLSELRAQLAAKYGKPAYDGPAVGTGEVMLMIWTYKGDKPSDCGNGSCRSDTADGVDVKDLAVYRRAQKAGHDLTITAMLLTGITDPTRAASLVVTVNDAATKLKTLESAVAQMRAAAHPAAGKPAQPRR